MSKIAIDIVLLLPDEIMDKAIETNKKLNIFSNQIKLNKTDCLPHLSLAMGCIEEKDLDKMDDILEKISNQFHPLSLEIDKIKTTTLPTGSKISGFVVEKNVELQKLHEMILEKFNRFLSYNAEKEMFYSAPDDTTITWVNNYLKKSSCENFSPHITLGFGDVDYEDFNLSFSANKIAICHLGNCCTCSKILVLKELKNNYNTQS